MLFNLHDYIYENLISGYANGSFTKEQVVIYSTNYMIKGIFSEKDVESIPDKLDEIDMEQFEATAVSIDEDTAEDSEDVTDDLLSEID